jgi:3-oxoadipate enol-lactonase
MVMPLWFTPSFHRDRAAELAGYRNMVSRQSVAGYTGTCAAIRDADYTQAAGRIAVPTLCVAGDTDGSTPPALVASMARLIPGARFETIRNAAHIMCVEQPEAVAALVRGFMFDVRGAMV